MTRSAFGPLLLALLSAVGCSEVATEHSSGPGVLLKPGSSGPSYTVLAPPVAPGWTALNPSDINTLHMVAGVMNPEGSASQMARRAAYWVAGGTAVPEALPVPAGKTWSVAAGLSDNGIIGGHIFPAGVLWKPNGSGWDIVTLDDHAVVNDVRSDGSAAGTVYNPMYDTFRDDPQPATWDGAGVLTRLPMPPSGRWSGGEALAINAQGDIAGTLEERVSAGPTYVWGALWVREADGYVPLVMQTGWARGLSDRTATGQIYVTASGVHDAYRHRFTRNASGVWSSDSVYVEGVAQRMNAAGDFVGSLEKGRFGSSPKPYVFPAGGSVLMLPLPKNANGAAVGISGDGWITGFIDGSPVVWKPGA